MANRTGRPKDPAHPAHDGVKGSKGHKLSDAFISMRRKRAFNLRLAGTPYYIIARRLNCASRTAYDDVHAVMEEMKLEMHETAEKVRDLDVMLLSEIQGMAARQLRKKYTWRRVAGLVKLMERKAKLLGLDAPARIDIEHNLRELAQQEGVDAEEVIREAERIIAKTVAR